MSFTKKKVIYQTIPAIVQSPSCVYCQFFFERVVYNKIISFIYPNLFKQQFCFLLGQVLSHTDVIILLHHNRVHQQWKSLCCCVSGSKKGI